MSVTVNINGLSLCHKGSTGVVTATMPDVCKTPTSNGPVPIPYPNIALSSDLAKGTKKVKADGGNSCAIKGSEFSKSSGDEPGTIGGVKSGVNMSKATWLLWSPDVFFEGKPVNRLTDKMLLNKGNTVSMGGECQPPVMPDDLDDKLCDMACECRGVSRFQQCVADKIKEEFYDGNYPKSDSPVWREVSMNQEGGVWQVIQNRAGTGPTSNPFTPGGGIRPDCIATDGAGNPTRMIEMKFPGDTYNANQNPANSNSNYNQAARDQGIEYDQIDVEEDCDCWNNGGGGSPVTVPATSPAEEGLSTGQKVGIGAGIAAGVAIVACIIAEPCGAALLLGGAVAGGTMATAM